MINKIFIINNLYHYKTLNKYFSFNKIKNESIVFYDSEIIDDQLNGFVEIPITLRAVYSDSFFQKYLKIKTIIKYINNLTIDLDDKFDLYLCSDKETFNQLFISILKPSSVHLFDEGIGMYRKKFFTSYIKNFIYILSSYIFFKHKIYFVQPLGTNPNVTDIYIRRRDLLGYFQESLNYHTLKTKIESNNFNNEVLLILPYDEKSFSQKTNFIQGLKSIICEISKYNLIINIKPHPRDKTLYTDFFNYKNVNIISNDCLAEDLGLTCFSLIIHYRSSSVLPLIFNNRDNNNSNLGNIISISLDSNHIIDNIYPNMVYFMNNRKIFDLIRKIVLNPKYFSGTNN